MNTLKKIFLCFLIISPFIIAQNYLIIPGGCSVIVPLGDQMCVDHIIVKKGAIYICEDTNGTCKNTILKKLNNIIPKTKLISFDARINKSMNVVLTWNTENETNRNGFYIERSFIEEQDFKRIGFVAANFKGSYSFIDNLTIPHRNYKYRLVEVFKDKSSSILNTIEIDLSPPSEYFLSQNYPNPFNPTTKIEYSIPGEKTEPVLPIHVVLKVYDILGNEVKTLINENKITGNYEVSFDASGLASGIYFYKLNAGNFSQTRKMILLR